LTSLSPGRNNPARLAREHALLTPVPSHLQPAYPSAYSSSLKRQI
jgi:hypothetical protein